MSSREKPDETVKVVVRCRPLNSKEQQDGRSQIVEMDEKRGTIALPANSDVARRRGRVAKTVDL